MTAEPIKDLYTELLDDHWRHAYKWNGIDPAYMAERHTCSLGYVRRVMLQIEKDHPKPRQSNVAICESCGADVVYIGGHACDPPVLKAVCADGTTQSVRLPHHRTCFEKGKWKGQSGAEKAGGDG